MVGLSRRWHLRSLHRWDHGKEELLWPKPYTITIGCVTSLDALSRPCLHRGICLRCNVPRFFNATGRQTNFEYCCPAEGALLLLTCLAWPMLDSRQKISAWVASFATCIICDQEIETIDHVLLGCCLCREVWEPWLRKLHVHGVIVLREEPTMEWWTRCRKLVPKPARRGFNPLFFLIDGGFGRRGMRGHSVELQLCRPGYRR